MEPVKVSVIVPVYKLQDYVAECISGLTTQKTDFRYEVIAIDDCSPDNSWSTLKELKKKVPDNLKIYRNAENKGLAATMQLLLEKVNGKYIVYLDGDDIALPGKLQHQADYLDSHNDCFMVYHEMDVFDSDSNETIQAFSKDYYNKSYIPQRAGLEHLIRYGCFVHIGSTMIRNHAHIMNTVDAENKIILDHPWLVLNQAYGNGSIDFIDMTLGRYRIHRNSFGGRTRQSIQRREQVAEEQLHICDLAFKHGLGKDIVEAGKKHYLFAASMYFLRAREDKLFIEYLHRSTDGKWFFNWKHECLWQKKNNPEALREQFYPAPA